ncbi:serine hydrolase [bacterium]|nr:serine hydrolase [bacterium]
MNRFCLSGLLVLLLVPNSLLAQFPSESIEKEVQAALDAGQMPGCVVVVAHQGKIVYEHAFGDRRIKPTQEAMTLDTVFDLASLTKPIATATSVMQLVEAGKVDLDAPVSQYLPKFQGGGKENITVRQLLIHTSGLTPDNALSDYDEGWDAAYEKICGLKLLSPPGEKFRYSDVGFIVLGELVHKVSGQRLDQYAKEHIFQPLKMTETGFNPLEPLRERAVTTTLVDGQWLKGKVHDPRASRCDGVAGHAGLFSTPHDMIRYAQGMLDARNEGPNHILKPETLQTMTSAYEVGSGLRGLGWDKQSGYSSNRGKTMTPSAYGHGGFTGTSLWIDPDQDLVVLFLSNRVHLDGKGSVNSLAGKIGTIASDALRE